MAVIAIGKDMVSNLKENKTLDFHFVDEGRKKDWKMAITMVDFTNDLSEKQLLF